MRKYEAPSFEILNMANDVIAASGLMADLSTTFDAIGRDLFSALEIGE